MLQKKNIVVVHNKRNTENGITAAKKILQLWNLFGLTIMRKSQKLEPMQRAEKKDI
jgi:hypothetical protein